MGKVRLFCSPDQCSKHITWNERRKNSPAQPESSRLQTAEWNGERKILPCFSQGRSALRNQWWLINIIQTWGRKTSNFPSNSLYCRSQVESKPSPLIRTWYLALLLPHHPAATSHILVYELPRMESLFHRRLMQYILLQNLPYNCHWKHS